ncbi:hypothetical protein [Rivularia sp. UHCC 0363]|uniref:hypothetical protein n=1 Tax=Rivularia sp. UHCC 0363 TaxID=3110244 RepID=UPI002B2099C6|nr:hypothetical protein [Rivularia sp. UHCC 0363]MEA5595839.1 hypothetical protein [Rivularia sp. UHCC 0363]
MTYLLFLSIGFAIIWLAINIKEEVYRISALIMGTLISIWGFSLSPTSFQVLIELAGVVSVFSFCVRCWSKD